MFSMGQARLRGTHFDRINQAREREREAMAAEQAARRAEVARRTLGTIVEGERHGLGGKYHDGAALAMAAREHGLRVSVRHYLTD